MRKTFLYRANVSKSTAERASTWLETCRILYNLCLEQRILARLQSKRSLSAVDQKNELPKLKKEFPEFAAVGSQVLQDVAERAGRAFEGFFRRLKGRSGKAGFPRFKSRNRYDSFTLKQAGWKLEGRNLVISGVGRFRLFLSRPVEGDIKTITIRKAKTGTWFVAFSCEHVPGKLLPESYAEVGIDLGLCHITADSEGNVVDPPKVFRKSEALLAERQRRLSSKTRGSRNRREAKLLVAKVHEKITNQRRDFLFKLANGYVRKYGVIYAEDLNIQGMARNGHLSKSIMDAGWGSFLNILSFKAAEAGRTFVRVNPNGTSQKCSRCHIRVPKDLSVRIHACSSCGLVLDRDVNAALNILRAGQALRGSLPENPAFLQGAGVSIVTIRPYPLENFKEFKLGFREMEALGFLKLMVYFIAR